VPDLATVEATSLHAVSVLVTASALARAESRGCHRWRDLPSTSGQPARHTVVHVNEGGRGGGWEVRLADPVGAVIEAVA
jgi:aspartate oxidase